AEEDGVAHACPVGNTGGSRKHAQVTLPAGQTTSLTFDVPAGLEPMYVQVSFNIRGAEDLGVRLRAPDGTEVDVTGSAGNQLEPLPGIVVYPTAQTTSRGTYFVDTILYAYKAQTVPMPIGSWEMSIEGDAESDARLDAYVMDEVSRWGEGVTFPHEVATDATTVGAPAVADHCIAVGAFTGHPSTDEEPWFRGDDPAGHVRSYSGRGPRIDGVERLDIVAPDNPFAAAPRIEDYFGTEIPAGAFWVFGGTSGAGPHVAGVATLLAQTGVRGDAAREAIRNGAIRDALTQSDAHAYGAGRLSAAGALGVQGDVEPPEVSLHVVGSAVVGEPALLSVVASDPGHPASSLLVRWDDGYDGTWDTEYAAELEREVVHEQVGRYPYKVRVRNPGGRVAEAVLWLDVGEAPPIEPDAGAMDAGTGGSDAGGPPAADASRLEPGGGCGCRFEGTNGPAPRGLGWFALLASLLLLRRRR
ncbi:MAG: S8 family serine peptidase, partial [Myxococcota bacterium]